MPPPATPLPLRLLIHSLEVGSKEFQKPLCRGTRMGKPPAIRVRARVESGKCLLVLGGIVNRRICVVRVFTSAALTFLLSLAATAQQITGSIRGTVTDPAGAIVSGASVTAVQLETDSR